MYRVKDKDTRTTLTHQEETNKIIKLLVSQNTPHNTDFTINLTSNLKMLKIINKLIAIPLEIPVKNQVLRLLDKDYQCLIIILSLDQE